MITATIALAGSPNCGKSALFNALTGANQKVGNYPGVTVEKKIGEATAPSGKKFNIIDLPGAYSLRPQSIDEKIAFNTLVEVSSDEPTPQAIVAVADATNLERTLGLILELRNLNKPTVVALNMMDLAQKRGLELDLNVLARELKVPVIPTVAIKKLGVGDLLARVEAALLSMPGSAHSQPINSLRPSTPKDVEARFTEVDRILGLAIKASGSPDVLSRRIDSVLLHPIVGPIILAVILLLLFQGVFTWAEPAMDLIEGAFTATGEFIGSFLPESDLRNLIVDGIIAGVGAVLVFLPQIIILFLFIFLLESSGYMTRAAFLMDRLMSSVGLQGKAFVPLLSSFACAIPGIMATRTIRNPRDRLVTILIAPLMTCSARLPVYVLLIGAFIPNTQVFGFFRLQGLVMFALFLAGVLSAVLVALILKLTLFQGPRDTFMLELPSYKMPSLRHVLLNVYLRAKVFIKKAGTMIMLVAVSLWFLSTYPKAPADWQEPAINYSFAGRIGHFIEPVVAPIGFDWRIATGLIPGFAAREVMVSALATVFAVEAEDEEAQALTLTEKLVSAWSLPVCLSLLAWYVFAPQCLATIAVAKRETHSWKWPAFMFAYLLGLAYLAAFVTYRVASALL